MDTLGNVSSETTCAVSCQPRRGIIWLGIQFDTHVYFKPSFIHLQDRAGIKIPRK